MTRKRPDPIATLAAEALGYLGGKEGFAALSSIVLDADANAGAREAAAKALAHYDPQTRVPNTPLFDAVMLLQVQNVVKGVADGLGGYAEILAQQIADAANRIGARDAVEPIAMIARSAALPLADVLGRVFINQQDKTVRAAIIDYIVLDNRQESSDFLAAIEKTVREKDEAKRIRKGLHTLSSRGWKAKPVVSGSTGVTALVNGCDGDACSMISVFVPVPTGIDVCTFVVHLVSGIRGAALRPNMPRAQAISLKEKLAYQPKQISATMPIGHVAKILTDGYAVDPQQVDQLPECRAVYARLKPVLSDAAPIVYPDVETGMDTLINAKRLLIGDGFDYWFFEAVEDTMQRATRSLDNEFRWSAPAGLEKVVRKRLDRAISLLVEDLKGTGERERVAAMLRHQALILDAIGRNRDARWCMRFARDLDHGVDDFLLVMATESLMRSLANERTPEEDWDRRESDALHDLRQIWADKRNVVKGDILALDLGAQLLATMIMRNRRLPSSQRCGLESLEQTAIAMAMALEGKSASALVFREVLDGRHVFPVHVRDDLAEALNARIARFIHERCDTCAHQCQAQPNAAASGLLFSDERPWRIPAAQMGGRGGPKRFD